jgi:hypothetical protein
MFKVIDIFFVIFHSSLIIFNLAGWIWKRTRLANLITLLLTGASWIFLGLIYGTLGYCPLTDWHFAVLEKLGKTDLPVSYVKYLADRLTGIDFDQGLIDNITLWSFIVAIAISALLNLRDLAARRK